MNLSPTLYMRWWFSEYSALDRQLDSLNSALDAIEQRNDDIHDKLRAILRENKEARESLKGGRSGTEDSDKGTPSNVKEGEPSWVNFLVSSGSDKYVIILTLQCWYALKKIGYSQPEITCFMICGSDNCYVASRSPSLWCSCVPLCWVFMHSYTLDWFHL